MKEIKEGIIKRIHVDRRILAQNRKSGKDLPAWTIQTSKGPIKARRVLVRGPTAMVQGAKPLKCGARMYIETWAPVRYA